MKKGSDNEIDFSMILASSVHDMKNSLGMLLSSLETLCERIPPENSDQLGVNTMRYEAERLNGDLIQLLGLYRLQQRTLFAQINEHHLGDLFAQLEAQHLPLLKGRNIKLDRSQHLELSWYFDRGLVTSILNNALNNAVRYTHNIIKLEAQKVNIEGHDFLEISVSDDGKGYPEDLLNLTPSDIQKNLSLGVQGTSLGLYFASEIAALHKQKEHTGFIALSNDREKHGGVFRLLLP